MNVIIADVNVLIAAENNKFDENHEFVEKCHHSMKQKSMLRDSVNHARREVEKSNIQVLEFETE